MFDLSLPLLLPAAKGLVKQCRAQAHLSLGSMLADAYSLIPNCLVNVFLSGTVCKKTTIRVYGNMMEIENDVTSLKHRLDYKYIILLHFKYKQ